MARLVLWLACLLFILASSFASAAIVEHTFYVKNKTVSRLCKDQVITAVNGRLPGPTIDVREGDTLVVHVFNKSPYNITLHWHGVFQLRSAWADGPNMVTQCPIQPGNSYTYNFTILKQEGTLWWHAHVSYLRATVYGALIIRPSLGHSYPFPKPYKEVPILLGEWWNANVVKVESEALVSGGAPNGSDAYTVNGLPGNIYPCSKKQTYKLKVKTGKTYLLRIINAALNNQLFFKIAKHNLTIVAVDASYTDQYITDVIVIAPGQTVDALLTADKRVGSYHMAASPYASVAGAIFPNTTTSGIIFYDHVRSAATAIMPIMPQPNDTSTAHKFSTKLTGLSAGPLWVPVPRQVDEKMLITIGLALDFCPGNFSCQRISASMNNHSFQFPSTVSMLESFFFNTGGIYTEDFPDFPPIEFDYTNLNNSFNTSLLFAPKGTSVKKLKFNSTVEIVLQNTALIGIENHPIHLHGHNFHVIAQGFGNYDHVRDSNNFNLVNPQIRNTIGVPVGGWAVIRFIANNPGVWLMHCHLDAHMPWGLAMAFVVENGPTPSTRLPPPPNDLPKC